MLNIFKPDSLRVALEKAKIWIAVLVMAAIGLTPILYQNTAQAAQLTNRSLTLSSSADGTTALGQGVTYTFQFNLATSGNVGSMQFEFCEQPLGTCDAPDGMDASGTSIGTNTINGGAGNFVLGDTTDAPTANRVRIERTPGAATAGHTVIVALEDIDNPTLAGNGTSFYARITVYSDAAYSAAVDDGVVAGAIVDQLTVTGRVQERLVFCVYALDDAAGSATPGTAADEMPASCAANEANLGADVDIGIVDNTNIAISPVDNTPPTSIGNDTFGAAQVNTNAPNGVVITYYATEASTGTEELRAFRVPGATCTNGGADTTDQCFISADGTTGETFTAGTERFGIQIACVANNSSTGGAGALGTTDNLGANGSGAGTAGTYNAAYSNADDDITDDASDDCENSDTNEPGAGQGVKFAWNDTATAQALISSDTVVDDEIVKMRFGATASATTPTGLYTAAATMIATATF